MNRTTMAWRADPARHAKEGAVSASTRSVMRLEENELAYKFHSTPRSIPPAGRSRSSRRAARRDRAARSGVANYRASSHRGAEEQAAYHRPQLRAEKTRMRMVHRNIITMPVN